MPPDAETVIPADLDAILADPALADLKDGPAKDFLVGLSAGLEGDGQQHTTGRYVLSIDERPGHEKVEVWAGPHKLSDRHARRVLATAMRRMMP